MKTRREFLGALAAVPVAAMPFGVMPDCLPAVIDSGNPLHRQIVMQHRAVVDGQDTRFGFNGDITARAVAVDRNRRVVVMRRRQSLGVGCKYFRHVEWEHHYSTLELVRVAA